MGHSVGVQHMYRWDGLVNEIAEGDLQVGDADLASP